MALTKVTSGGIADIAAAVEGASDSNKFTDADHSKLNGIAASANNYTHPNHSGEVTSTADGATVIADNVVDEANLKVSNSPTNGYALTAQSGNTGGLTWAAMSSGATSLNGLSDCTVTADDNIGIGSTAVDSITTGDQNVGVGVYALTATTTGGNNSGFGHQALYANTTGSANTAVGRNASENNTTANHNVSVGYYALKGNSTGIQNTAVGSETLMNTTSNNNTAVGYNALKTNTTGTENCAVGTEALHTNVTGIENTAVGHKALTANTGDANVAVGREALKANTSGGNNVGLGYLALLDNTTGSQNVAVGQQALKVATTADYNTAVGSQALKGNTVGNNNTAIGYASGQTTTSGTYNIMLGRAAYSSSATASNECTLGGTYVNNLRCNDTSISSLSDSRDKTSIEDIPLGLAFINTVRPVAFDWNCREDNEDLGLVGEMDVHKAGKKDFGFIAQELKTAANATDYADHMRLVSESNPNRLEADPMKMFPVLVKAIQELSAKNDALEARITTLEG